VPEPLLHDLRVDAGGEEQARVGDAGRPEPFRGTKNEPEVGGLWGDP
jgi:hypothetical protein